MLLHVPSEGILEEDTEPSAPMQLRHYSKAVFQEGHKIISFWVQTHQSYCTTTKNVLLYSDRCTNQTNDLPFILRYVLRKSLHPAGSFSMLLHPRKPSKTSKKSDNCSAALGSFIHCVWELGSHSSRGRFTSLAYLLPHLYFFSPFGGVYLLPDLKLQKSGRQVTKKATIILPPRQLHNFWATQGEEYLLDRYISIAAYSWKPGFHPYTRFLPYRWS